MAKTKKHKEDAIPSEDLIAQAIHEGRTLIAEGKTKVEAAMVIYRLLENSSQETIITAFIDGASLTPNRPSLSQGCSCSL